MLSGSGSILDSSGIAFEKIAFPSALWVVIRRFIFRSLPSCAIVTFVSSAGLLKLGTTE